MTPLFAVYLLLVVIIYPLLWFKGGPPERLGAVICMLGWVATILTHDVTIGKTRIAEAGVDLITLVAFLWMSVAGRRWWPMAAAACMAMMLIVHLSTAMIPTMSSRADSVARLGLSVLLMLTLAAGALERWLAGDAPGGGRFKGMIRNRVLNI